MQLKNTTKRKVLFLCSGNSARSQMAEAILRHRAGELFDVYSAGTKPEKIDERTKLALKNFGVSSESLVSKNVEQFQHQYFDYVITLCDKAEQECRLHPWFSSKAGERYMAWDFPDPKTRNVSEPFSVTLNEINTRIAMFVIVEGKHIAQLHNHLLTNQPDITQEIENEITLDPISFYKCLTDELRLKTLMLVNYNGELCVCELMAALQEQSQPKISRNLALLRKAKILTDRKHGQWVFYRLNPQLPAWARSVLAKTTEQNVSYIEDNLQHLALMNNRPDKTRFCCV